jgi:DNA-binding NtrC family response regulator
VRQLKNVTEQISLLSEQREITEDILREYLPEVKSNLPMLATGKNQQGKTFESERDILYQVLFDMRKDMTELKRQVNALMGGEMPIARQGGDYNPKKERPYVGHVMESPATISITSARERMHDDFEYQDTEEYVEEALSIEDAEKELIRKALLRSRGKRKIAARELKISERTLYRKIKEYNLENY